MEIFNYFKWGVLLLLVFFAGGYVLYTYAKLIGLAWFKAKREVLKNGKAQG